MLHAPTHTEAWVEVSDNNGVTWSKLPEYKEDLQEKSAECYIEAKTGQRFRLSVQETNTAPTRTDFVAKYFYDGNHAISYVVQTAQRNPSMLGGIYKSDQRFLPFKFSDLLTTNDEEKASDELQTAEVGKLRIELWRVKVTGPAKAKSGSLPYAQKAKDEAFLEQRVKKLTNHQVGFDEATPAPPRTFVPTTYKDTKPYLVFHFNYMSDALLDINKIRPFVLEDNDAVAGRSGETTSTSAGPSSDRAGLITAKKEINKDKKRKETGKTQVIDHDGSDQTSELERLRAENTRLKKKVKLEKISAGSAGTVIDLSED